MANTYSQLNTQFIFAVKKRKALILDPWRPLLHKYITGIVQKNGHRLLQINSMPDHVHLFVGMRPVQSCSGLMQMVKGSSTSWINENTLCPIQFAWQGGFGAFAYSQSHVDNVIRYIQNQQVHHRKISFRDEYRKILQAFNIDFDEQYIFHEPY